MSDEPWKFFSYTGDSPVLTVDILRPAMSAHSIWTLSDYGVQWWIVDENKFTNLRLNIC